MIEALSKISKEQVEDFLIHEARLLDKWKLDDWLQLLTEDCYYHIPSNNIPEGDPKKDLFLISDDRKRIDARVKRLKSPLAHIENPHSRTRRLISNIFIAERTENDISVQSNFIVHRFRRYEEASVFVGEYHHKITIEKNQLKICERKVVLDSEELGSLGTISFIL
jgi:p-cumate 2,3-dioxygenase beta subunit